MTTLTDKQQTLVGSIGFQGTPTTGTCLTGVVSIDLDGHGPTQASFVGNHAVQLGKAPFRGSILSPVHTLVNDMFCVNMSPYPYPEGGTPHSSPCLKA